MERSSKLMLKLSSFLPEKGGVRHCFNKTLQGEIFSFSEVKAKDSSNLKDNVNLCNVLVIPQIGTVDSLNLSVAASLCIVESRRQKGLLSTTT